MAHHGKPCACGRVHGQQTLDAAAVKGAAARLAGRLEENRLRGGILMLCDPTTYEALGAEAERALAGVAPVDVGMLRGRNLHADEEAVGAALIAATARTRRIVAVGSGTLNDTARYVAARMGVPYDVLGTAPSMDGYVSTVSPLHRRGFKVTFEAVAPEYAYLDIDVMRQAPMAMIAAGLGDVMGKYTALADWAVAREVWGEYYCGDTAELMRRAVDVCASGSAGLPAREEASVRALGEGLLLSGLAMQRVGNSRPASGLEHHMAHFWEIMQLARGETPTLHGDKVGFAELLALRYYRVFFGNPWACAETDAEAWERGVRAAYGPVAAEVLANRAPPALPAETLRENAAAKWDALRAIAEGITPLEEDIRDMLTRCGGPTTARELGLSREDVENALLYAMEMRPRPTAMRLAFALGAHRQICAQVTEEMYG